MNDGNANFGTLHSAFIKPKKQKICSTVHVQQLVFHIPPTAIQFSWRLHEFIPHFDCVYTYICISLCESMLNVGVVCAWRRRINRRLCENKFLLPLAKMLYDAAGHSNMRICDIFLFFILIQLKVWSCRISSLEVVYFAFSFSLYMYIWFYMPFCCCIHLHSNLNIYILIHFKRCSILIHWTNHQCG